jgi:uncharacterized protein YdeI (YjbR/CyaY-like superfamily)
MAAFFENQDKFREWLTINHERESELIVGFYKVNSGLPSMSWSESVDQALCFGWIDGVRKSIDEKSYQIRFTKRRTDSIWSSINIQKVENLIQKELMQDAGLQIYEKRKLHKSEIYAYENVETDFPEAFENLFKEQPIAWDYFNQLTPSYQKTSKHWVMSAKQEKTQIKRLVELINDSQNLTNKWKDNKYSKK